MDTKKMREQFESFALGDATLKQYGLAKYPADGDEYDAIPLQAAWVAWQASRDAVVVELPNAADHEVYEERSDCLHVDDAELMKAVRIAIEDQGLKVAP